MAVQENSLFVDIRPPLGFKVLTKKREPLKATLRFPKTETLLV